MRTPPPSPSPWPGLVVDALATYRLTRLATADVISEPLRMALLRLTGAVAWWSSVTIGPGAMSGRSTPAVEQASAKVMRSARRGGCRMILSSGPEGAEVPHGSSWRAVGKSGCMAFNGARALHRSTLNGEAHVLVKTREHEVIDFEGCAREEAEAKVHDFLAWAS